MVAKYCWNVEDAPKDALGDVEEGLRCIDSLKTAPSVQKFEIAVRAVAQVLGPSHLKKLTLQVSIQSTSTIQSNILLRSSLAHSNGVLTFPNNIYGHGHRCYSIGPVLFEQCKAV